MRKIQFKMAAKFFILAVILVCGFFATSANATPEVTSTALLFTYYDVRTTAEGGLGVSDNYFTVTNPTSAWTQAHVRVRTGDCSVELLDFDVMLSPKDVFTFDLSRDGDGIAFSSLDLHTIENSKMLAPFLIDINGDGEVEGIAFSTNPDSVLGTTNIFSSNLTSLILTCGDCRTGATITEDQARLNTLKGYVEVIVEGQIEDCDLWVHGKNTNGPLKGLCPGETQTCDTDESDLVDITKHTLYELNGEWDDNVDGLCWDSVNRTTSRGIDGREYFASVDFVSTAVTRLTHMNAEGTDDRLPIYENDNPQDYKRIILHQNTFSDEIASSRCEASIGNQRCFSYNKASVSLSDLQSGDDSKGGAADMNYCFYTDTILAGNPATATGVFNKFGAAATFGPTIADLIEYECCGVNFMGKRNGRLRRTAHNLTIFAFQSSFLAGPSNGLSDFNADIPVDKAFINSHFFFSPAPAVFDIRSAFAFIFPVKHFIGESVKLNSFVFYDLDENTLTPPTTGFISPGLPGPQAPTKEEAFLQTLTGAPFAEGWVQIGRIEATNLTENCHFPGLAATPGTIWDTRCLVMGGTESYTPGWTGATYIIGPDALSSSLLQVIGRNNP